MQFTLAHPAIKVTSVTVKLTTTKTIYSILIVLTNDRCIPTELEFTVTPYVQIFLRIAEESFKIGLNIIMPACWPP